MVKAIAFFAKDISEVNEGNLALSWFSKNEPRSVVSEQVDFIVLIPLTSLLMLPLVDWNAWVIQKYLLHYQKGDCIVSEMKTLTQGNSESHSNSPGMDRRKKDFH